MCLKLDFRVGKYLGMVIGQRISRKKGLRAGKSLNSKAEFGYTKSLTR